MNKIWDGLLSKAGLKTPEGLDNTEKINFERKKWLKFLRYMLYGITFNLLPMPAFIPAFFTLSINMFAFIMPICMLAGAGYCLYKFYQQDKEVTAYKQQTDPKDTQNLTSQPKEDYVKNMLKSVACITASILIGMAIIPIPLFPFLAPILAMGLMSFGLSTYITSTLEHYNTYSGIDNLAVSAEGDLKKLKTNIRKEALATTVITAVLMLISTGVIAFPIAIPAIFIIGATITMVGFLISQGIAYYRTEEKLTVKLQPAQNSTELGNSAGPPEQTSSRETQSQLQQGLRASRQPTKQGQPVKPSDSCRQR